jgi:hypothetical protein
VIALTSPHPPTHSPTHHPTNQPTNQQTTNQGAKLEDSCEGVAKSCVKENPTKAKNKKNIMERQSTKRERKIKKKSH